MTDAPAPSVQELELADGSKVHVRPLKPEDEGLLHDAFSRMSERSVYFRFFSPLKRLPPDLAHRLATVDGTDRYAVCATSHRVGADRAERIVGVARYDRVPGTDIAEVAVAVTDDFQRRGLGSGLLGMVAGVARRHGIRTFMLIVLPENASMLRLLRRLGWIHKAKLVGGMYEISFEL